MSKAPHIDQATAMMLAADILEQPGRYDYYRTKARYCETYGGCPLAWIAYILGFNDDKDSAEWLGYSTIVGFFDDMYRVTQGRWHDNPTLAATGLRRLARERAI